MNNIMPEPDFDSFDGVYAGSNDSDYIMPPTQYNLSALAEFMRKHEKKYEELSKDEIEQFKLN